jgi:hypothetical protein
MAQSEVHQLQEWQKLCMARLVRCPAWQSSIRSLSYVDFNTEEIMHDNPSKMDPEDGDLDETAEMSFYSGCVVVLDAQHIVAKEWVRHVYEMVPDRGSMYMVWWNEGAEPPTVTFSTTDRCLLQRASAMDQQALAKEFLAKKDEMVAKQQVSLIGTPTKKDSQPTTTMRCARLTWEALYEDRCLECLNPLLPTLEEHFQAYLSVREGSGKEVAVPLSFWNYRARRFLASQQQYKL